MGVVTQRMPTGYPQSGHFLPDIGHSGCLPLGARQVGQARRTFDRGGLIPCSELRFAIGNPPVCAGGVPFRSQNPGARTRERDIVFPAGAHVPSVSISTPFPRPHPAPGKAGASSQTVGGEGPSHIQTSRARPCRERVRECHTLSCRCEFRLALCCFAASRAERFTSPNASTAGCRVLHPTKTACRLEFCR